MNLFLFRHLKLKDLEPVRILAKVSLSDDRIGNWIMMNNYLTDYKNIFLLLRKTPGGGSAEIPRKGTGALLIDGMSVVRSISRPENLTWSQLARKIFCLCLAKGEDNQRIDIVFDWFPDLSIKFLAHQKRSGGQSARVTKILTFFVRRGKDCHELRGDERPVFVEELYSDQVEADTLLFHHASRRVFPLCDYYC